MDPGAMARAMIFVCLVVLGLFVGFFTFIHAAYSFLVTAQDTAAGVDEVRWPHDPFYDKLPRAGYLAALLIICAAPAGVFLKLNPEAATAESPALTALVAATAILWALFPIGFLSALSASSPWIVFRLTVLRFYFRRFGAVVIFYVVSAVLAGGSFALLYLALDRGSWLLTFVAPVVTAAAFLIYARLLGRLAYLFDQSPGRRRRRDSARRASETKEAVTERKSAKKKKKMRIEDPWETPVEPAKPKSRKKGERRTGYAIAEGDTTAAPEEKPQPYHRVKGYRLSDEPLPPRPTELPQDGYIPVGYEPVPNRKEEDEEALPSGADDASVPSGLDSYLRERPQDISPPPAHPLVTGVYSFPFYPGTIPAWVFLSLGGIMGCALLQGMLVFRPW